MITSSFSYAFFFINACPDSGRGMKEDSRKGVEGRFKEVVT